MIRCNINALHKQWIGTRCWYQKNSEIRRSCRINCIACLSSAKCVLVGKNTVSCFSSIRSGSKFCYSHPISKLLLPKRKSFVCTAIPLFSPSLLDYMDRQPTVTATATDNFLMRIGTFVRLTEAMIAMSTFAYNTRLPTCSLLALMWSQRK